jgi:hypothetical protein
MKGRSPLSAPLTRLTRRRYLVIPGFFTPEETTEMLDRAHQLLNEFRIEGHPLVSPITEEGGLG